MKFTLFLNPNDEHSNSVKQHEKVKQQLRRFAFLHPSEVKKTNIFVEKAANPWAYDLSSFETESLKISDRPCKASPLTLNASYLETEWFGGEEYVRYVWRQQIYNFSLSILNYLSF